MSTSVGSVHLDIAVSTAKALTALRAFGSQATTILKPITNVELKVKTTVQKPKVADLRAALAGVTATVKVDIAVKPLTQRALNAALAGVKAEKKIKITVDSADAATRLANIRTVLSNLGTTVRNLFNINVTSLNAVLTAGTAMLTRFGTVITDLRALITQLNAAGGRPNGPPGGGAGGGAAASGYSAQLRLLQADLKAGALNTGSFDTATRALKATIDAEIASLRGLGVLTADQQKKLDSLRISSGQAGAALKGLGTGPAASVAQLARELDIANSRFERGDITLREYLREQQRITAAGAALRGSLAAGSAEAQKLESVFGKLRTATQGINSKSIDQVKASLSQARAAFDQAATAASTYAQKRDAIIAYQRSVDQLTQRITSLGQRTNLTAQQTKQLADLQARLAREQATLQGGTNPLGLGANVLNALRAAFPLVQQVGGSLGAAASQAGQFGGGLGNIATSLGPVGIAVGVAVIAIGLMVVALASAVNKAADFEAVLADIQARTRDASQPVAAFTSTLKQLSDAATTFGQPLGIGAKQAAQGILELNKAGLSAQQVLQGGLKGAMDLAGAAGEDLATAAKQAVGAMSAFGLAAKDLPHVADVFANFAGQTFLDAGDFSLALAAVGPVARDAGLNIEQLAGAMATLAQGGFKNMSDAGTSFKTMLLSLQAPSDTARKYMKAIGFNAFDAQGNLKPLTTSLAELKSKLVQLTPEAQKQLLKQIFGTDSIRAAQILLREGPAALDANTKAMGKAGEAARVAKERLDSLRGSQGKLGAAFENLQTKIGLPFLAPLKAVVDAVTSVVISLTNGGAAAGQTGTAFQQFAAGVQQAVQPLGVIVGAVFQAIAVIWNTVLRPVLSAIGTVFSLIAQVIFTAITLVGNIVVGVFTGIGSFLSSVFGPIFGQNMNNIKCSLADVAAAFARWAGAARAYLVAGGKVAGQLPALFGAVGKSIGGIFQGIGTIFKGFGLLAYERLVKPVLPIAAAVGSAFRSIAETIGGVVTGILNFVAQKFSPLANFLQTIGISIGASLQSIIQNVGNNIRDLIGSSADGFTAQANAQAAAARDAATGTNAALDTIKDGAAQVVDSVKAISGAVTTFGSATTATFAQAGVDIAKANTAATKLQTTLAKPYVATVPLALPSGTKTLADLGLGPTAKKGKATPVTAADLAGLDTYKKGLKDMSVQELLAAKATAIHANDKKHLTAILAELNLRTREGTAENKKAATAAVAATKKEAAEAKKLAAELKRQTDARTTLVRELRQSIAVFKLQSDQGKVSAQSQLAFNNRIEDFQARIAKLPPELQRGTEGLVAQAQQLSKNAALHVAASQKAAQQAASAKTLAREITQLNDRFRLQSTEGKVTAKSLLAYQQRLETLKDGVSKLPPALQSSLVALLGQGQGLATAGQKVVDYKSQLSNLAKAVKEYTFAELESARARVVASGGDQKKLDLIDAQIKKYKQLTGAQVDQADAESRLATAGTSVSGLEGGRDNALAAAKGNLAEIYRVTVQYGQQIQDAQEIQARSQAAKDVLDVNDKYAKLLDLAGISNEQRTRLEIDQAAEVLAIDTGLTNTLAKNSADRTAAEADAKRSLDDRLQTMSRESRDTIRKDLLDGLKRDTAALESAQQEQLDAEDLTEAEKLAIRQRYQPLLLAQKAREMEASRAIDLQAESDRYDDQVTAAKLDGTFAAQETKLLEVHTAELARINRDYDDQTRDYSVGVKRDTGKQLVAAQKETSAGLLDEAKGHVSDILDTVDTNEAAQRESARNTLIFWRATYAAMGLAGKASVAEIDAAIRKLDLVGQKARTDAGKLVVQDGAGVARQGAADLLTIGKPDDVASASAKASAQFDTLRDTYVKKLDELQTALSQFADVRDQDLTPDQRQIRDGLLGTQQLYQGLLDNVVLASLQAGDAAGVAFTQAQTDRLSEAGLALAEANRNLAESTGGDDMAAYRAALVVYQTYWSDRVKVLQKGLASTKEGTPEYEAATAALIDANGKLATSNKGLADSDKAVLDKRDAAIDAALQLAEAQRALAVQRGQDGDAAYVQGLQVALDYWRGRLVGLTAGSTEYLAALQKVTELEGKVLALKADTSLTRALDSASGLLSGSTGFPALIKTSLDGLSSYFKNGGGDGGSRSILLGAAALVSGLAAVFTTGDAEMDKVTNGFVNGISTVLNKLASGDTFGAILAGAATVISTIVDIFGGGANSAKKAAEEIASATSGVRFFDLSKYAKTVSAGGFFGWLGFKKSEIDTESVAIAKTLGDALYDAVSGGMLDGIKAGKSSFGDLGIDIKKSLSTQILQGLIDGFLKSAIFQATVQPFLDKYITAMKSGNSQALAEAASGLQGAISTSNGQLQAFYQNVLVPAGQQLGVFGSDSSTSSTTIPSAASQLGMVPGPVVQNVTSQNAASAQALNITVVRLGSTVDSLKGAVDVLQQRGIALDISLSKQADRVSYQSTTGALRQGA